MIEFPLAMWTLFVMITIPMIDLSVVSLRSTFLMAAAHHAAHSAARSKTFVVGIDSSNLSSKEAALSTVNSDVARFTGVRSSSVSTSIVITNLTTNAVTSQTTKLTLPADTSANNYSIEVVVTGQVDPLLSFGNSPLGSIPGLGAPLTVAFTAQEFCENPQGLTQ